MLRAMGEAAIERLRCRVLRKGLEGWGAWRERKVWERDAVERAWEWKVRRSLRLCFLGWQSEAGKRRVLLDRLLSPGARKTGEVVSTLSQYLE